MSFIRLFFMITWTFTLMLMSPLFIILTFNRQTPLVIARVFFAPGLMKIAGIRLKIKGKENVPLDEPVIFIANHSSHLDIGCLCGSLPVNLHFIGKKELIWTPVVGWYMFIAGHIFVDRRNRKKAIVSLQKAAKKIKEGKSVVMYPEGTRTKTGEIGPFKKGAFYLALDADVKIVPIHINGTYKVWPTKSSTITPGNVDVTIGKPIDSSRYSKKNISELIQDAKAEIEALSK